MVSLPERDLSNEQSVTLGCVNFDSEWGDKAANLAKIKGLTKEAAMQGIDIVAFPELALSGYECSAELCMHRELAETIPGPATEELCALAREHNMYIVFGMPEQDAVVPERRYISCPFIGPEGLIGTYRKLHLGPPPIFTETLCFTGGTSIPVFDTRFGKVGIQICADFWMYPEVARIQMLKGARLIINCSGSPDLSPDRRAYMTQQTGARATENLVYAATANLVGKENTISFYGCSTIAGPEFPRFNHIYAQGGDGEEIVSATLSFSKLNKFREAVPIRNIRRDDILLREFNELDRNSAEYTRH
ncbi:MAG: carbon-nitrogen hydrolase family protein [Gammaproteobacteria bacterium]|nr:carbon-nitrogen hydrolase family protein [Gammaproteobacteria bacterium]